MAQEFQVKYVDRLAPLLLGQFVQVNVRTAASIEWEQKGAQTLHLVGNVRDLHGVAWIFIRVLNFGGYIGPDGNTIRNYIESQTTSFLFLFLYSSHYTFAPHFNMRFNGSLI